MYLLHYSLMHVWTLFLLSLSFLALLNKSHRMGYCNFTCIATCGVSMAQTRWCQIRRASLSLQIRSVPGIDRINAGFYVWFHGSSRALGSTDELRSRQGFALKSAIWFYTCQTPRHPSALYSMTSSARHGTRVFEKDTESLPDYNHRYRHSLTARSRNAL